MQQGSCSLKNVPIEIYEGEKRGVVQAGMEDKRRFCMGMPKFSEAWHRVLFTGQCCLFSNFATLCQCRTWSHQSFPSPSLYECCETEILNWVGGSWGKGTPGQDPEVTDNPGWHGPQWVSSSSCCSESGHLWDWVIQCFVLFCLENLQGRQLYNLPRQPLPLPGCPHREVNSNIHLELVFA